jgi:hypothetical protein
MLEGLESELRRRFQQEPKGNLMHVLEDSFSNSVQMTRAKAYLAESIETGVEELMRMYVEPLKRERVSRVSGRAAIQAQMRTEFERAGVWDLLRKRIAASQYTRPGDPLRIDLGYRPNGVIRMFQAVSLEAASGTGLSSGLETAKALAFSAPGLIAGVERVEKAALELTAVNREQGTGNRKARSAGRRVQRGQGVRFGAVGGLPICCGDDGGAADSRADYCGSGARCGDGATGVGGIASWRCFAT